MIVSIFNPLQGFFNAFIYARPRYLRLKKKNKHMGFKQLIKLSFLPDDGRGGTRSPANGSNLRLSDSAHQSKKSSNVFRSFLSSLTRKETTASYPAVSETEVAKEKTMTCSDKKPIQDADIEKGKVGEGEKTNRDISPAEDEEESFRLMLTMSSLPLIPSPSASPSRKMQRVKLGVVPCGFGTR